MQSAHLCLLLIFTFATFVAPLPAQDHSIPVTGVGQIDSNVRRFELGGRVSDIRIGCSSTSGCIYPQFALGLGAALNINQYFAIDANWSVTPGYSQGESFFAGGRSNEFLVGVRAGLRAKHYGYFIEAQPGLLYWNNVVTPQSVTHPFSPEFGGRSWFVSDVGGGLEYSPGGRVHIRAEVSDLVSHYGGTSWGNNLQSTAGIYMGAGKPIDWTPPSYDAKKVHRFFNVSNNVLLMGSVLATAADSITTQRFIRHGMTEGDPFVRPLVKSGWSGQITAAGLEISAEILGMYGLHRIGQHWVERLLPACITAAHGIFAYHNTQID